MLGFTFPGQGSQRPGMGQPWTSHPSWELVIEASDVSHRDLAHLLLDADADELKRTDNAQLSTYVLSLVVLDAVERVGLTPAVCAGHSLGEYTALTAAGALSVADGASLVTERGNAMAAAADSRLGTMAAILGLDIAAAHDACAAAQAAGADVWIANDNAPGQIVIAGTPEGIEAATGEAKARGAKKLMALPVGGAFHSPLMAPARDRLAKALEGTDFRTPEIPVVANVDAAVHTDRSEWAELLAAQLTSPVRWRDTLAALVAAGATTLVELGPGNVLTGLAKRGAPGVPAVSIATPADLEAALAGVAARAGRPTPAQPTDSSGGDHPHLAERMIVSPATGVFEPNSTIAHVHPGPGTPCRIVTVEVGSVLGHIAGREVRSPFAGQLMGMLALAGERVTETQPIAWLRTP